MQVSSKRRRKPVEDKSYPIIARVLRVLDYLLRNGPQTTPELARALGLPERTTYRFMSAMLRVWPGLLWHRLATSEPMKWDLNTSQLRHRFTRGNHRKPATRPTST